MCEPPLKLFMSSLGSRTSVLSISHPVVSIYTHRHTFENFEILNFFAFDCHHWRGMEFFLQFLVPLGAHTCSWWVSKHILALFEAFPNTKSILGVMLCFKLRFWQLAKKTSFCTFLPPMQVSKLRFGPYRENFLGASGAPNMLKNGQKGLPRFQKAPINVQNILGVLRKPFLNFRKIVEFSTFRQH